MATPEIPQSLLERFKRLPTPTLYTAVRNRGATLCFMEGVNAFTPGRKMVGRARTLRMVPPRPDIHAEVSRGEDSPEYHAMGSCGPGDVLVVDAMRRPYSTILGDIRLTQLMLCKAEGLVTDGGVRDLDVVSAYGLAIFAARRTPTARESGEGWEANVVIQCAGVAVRPGDVIVGDNDGVVVVPAYMAEEVADWGEIHEAAEELVKERILAEQCAPGRYYPPTDAFKAEMLKARGAKK